MEWAKHTTNSYQTAGDQKMVVRTKNLYSAVATMYRIALTSPIVSQDGTRNANVGQQYTYVVPTLA